ncbi:MAG: AsmA-like C-terminal region-containing protein [Bacteroidota bacterium]
MRLLGRILKGGLIFIVLLVGFLLLAPMLFKDQIIATVKSSINENIAAELDFKDANLSFLRSFPDVSLTVDEFTLMGIDTFAGRTLASGQSASVDIDFWSIWAANGNYEIEAIELEQPTINLLILQNGLANYDIALPTEETADAPLEEEAEPSENLAFDIKYYEIIDGRFVYDDRSAGIFMEIDGLDHRGSGDLTFEVFDLDTETQAEAVTFVQGGVAYLRTVKADIDAKINVNTATSTYTFKENTMRINDLALQADGSIALVEDDVVFDLVVNAPANDFKQLWSLMPTAYTSAYSDMQAAGSFVLNATVNGAYNADRPSYPAIDLQLGIDGGSVQYPGMPMAINGIFTDLRLQSPSADLDQLKLDVSRFAFVLGGEPFQGNFKLSTPMSDPQVDARLDGRIDLDRWAQAIPMEDVDELSGVIDADVTINGARQSLLEAGLYDQVDMSGNVLISDLVYAAPDYPRLTIAEAEAALNPESLDLRKYKMTAGNSDLEGSGRIDNLLAYFSPDKTMRGDLTLRSNLLDVDEFMPETDESTGAISPAEHEQNFAEANEVTHQTEVFDRFDFAIDAEVGELRYGGYQAMDSRFRGHIQPNRLQLDDFGTRVGNSPMSGSGTIFNALDYGLGKAALSGNLTVSSPHIELSDFMIEEEGDAAPSAGTTQTSDASESAVVPIPEDIDLAIAMRADEVIYTNIELRDVRGDLLIRDQAVVVENGGTRLLGGLATFAGAYDTSNPEDPGFRFHYDLQELDFQQAFNTFNSFAALAPIGKFVSGKFSSDLILEGSLGDDLYPVLESIDAQGFLATLDAQLAQIQPLQKVGNALNIPALKSDIDLSALQTWFTIEDGTVEVEPFDLTVAGIPMNVRGTHGLNNDMSYEVLAAVPREMIEGNIVTGAALSALDGLAGQASRLGFDIAPGDVLNLRINIGGSMANPTTTFNLVGKNEGNTSLAASLTEQAEQEIRATIDEHVAETREQLESEVDTRVEDARTRIDSTRNALANQANNAVDSIRNAAGQQVNQVRNEAINRVGEALGLSRDSTRRDSTAANPAGQAIENAAEEIKNEINRFNPFRRRNGGN